MGAYWDPGVLSEWFSTSVPPTGCSKCLDLPQNYFTCESKPREKRLQNHFFQEICIPAGACKLVPQNLALVPSPPEV